MYQHLASLGGAVRNTLASEPDELKEPGFESGNLESAIDCGPRRPPRARGATLHAADAAPPAPSCEQKARIRLTANFKAFVRTASPALTSRELRGAPKSRRRVRVSRA